MAQQFIPFEDDWDALSRLGVEALVPYRIQYRQPVAQPPSFPPLSSRLPINSAEDAVFRPG